MRLMRVLLSGRCLRDKGRVLPSEHPLHCSDLLSHLLSNVCTRCPLLLHSKAEPELEEQNALKDLRVREKGHAGEAVYGNQYRCCNREPGPGEAEDSANVP